MTQLLAIDEGRFIEQVERSAGVVLVDFSANWCAPCRMMTPILDALAAEYAERARLVNVDADASPTLTARYGVRGLPTLLFFRDGVVVDRITGTAPAGHVRERLDRLLAT